MVTHWTNKNNWNVVQNNNLNDLNLIECYSDTFLQELDKMSDKK